MKIKLSYITSLGCDWLENEVEVTKENYKEVVDSYVKENQQTADALVEKWGTDGEDEFLILYVSSDEPSSELYSDVFAYVEYVDDL